MKNNQKTETNWCVITGGPSTGKTTIGRSRHYIDTRRVKRQIVEELRSNTREFQLDVLDM